MPPYVASVLAGIREVTHHDLGHMLAVDVVECTQQDCFFQRVSAVRVESGDTEEINVEVRTPGSVRIDNAIVAVIVQFVSAVTERGRIEFFERRLVIGLFAACGCRREVGVRFAEVFDLYGVFARRVDHEEEAENIIRFTRFEIFAHVEVLVEERLAVLVLTYGQEFLVVAVRELGRIQEKFAVAVSEDATLGIGRERIV